MTPEKPPANAPFGAKGALEPGPTLDAKIEELERRILSGSPADRDDLLILVATIRELLRDRDALLEEIEALERLQARR